jgi:hypothetical protein
MPRVRQPGGLSDELDPYVDRAEAERFDRVGALLREQHPAPSDGFLTGIEAGGDAAAPVGWWAQVGAALAAGLLLLALALLGASGSGPLGG